MSLKERPPGVRRCVPEVKYGQADDPCAQTGCAGAEAFKGFGSNRKDIAWNKT
jgi:hypothetical protein